MLITATVVCIISNRIFLSMRFHGKSVMLMENCAVFTVIFKEISMFSFYSHHKQINQGALFMYEDSLNTSNEKSNYNFSGAWPT